MRKLFVAIDETNNKIHVDSLKSEENTNSIYFCPYCKKEVIPKLSNLKDNHFAHKDGICGVELNIDTTKEYKKTLTEYELVDKNPFEKKVTSQTIIRCKICQDITRIENAIKIKENIFLCKKCMPRIKEISKEL